MPAQNPRWRSKTYLIVVVSDNIGDSRTPVLHLNPSVRAKGIQSHGPVVVESIRAVLPVDGRLDAGRVGGVGFVSVCSFFEKAGVCAVIVSISSSTMPSRRD